MSPFFIGAQMSTTSTSASRPVHCFRLHYANHPVCVAVPVSLAVQFPLKRRLRLVGVERALTTFRTFDVADVLLEESTLCRAAT
jgi:hypothetical protein